MAQSLPASPPPAYEAGGQLLVGVPTNKKRLVLLDASGCPEGVLSKLLESNSTLSVFLSEGQPINEEADNAKASALKAAFDVGALSEEEYHAAMARLQPGEVSEGDRQKMELLQAAFEGGALTEDQFRDAVARFHLALELKVGDRVEVRDSLQAEWRGGEVKQITASSGSTQIWVQPDGYDTSYVWGHIRRPEDRRTDQEKLAEELAKVKQERDDLAAQVQRLLSCLAPTQGEPRTLMSAAQPGHSKYEMFGFAFDVKGHAQVKITGIKFGTRATRPAQVTVYASSSAFETLRQDPASWRVVSEVHLVQGSEDECDLIEIPFLEPITLLPGGVKGILIHSPDDMRAVQYHRRERTQTSDGCIEFLGGDAAQSNRIISGTYSNFSFVGCVDYVVMEATAAIEASAAPADPPSTTPPAPP
eukprot:Sspe_Gene.18873::Locus_6823_Transcript_1_1_Confidence_1.000_Length_3094::g.18873::m.18873